jgi:hypothetical protein
MAFKTAWSCVSDMRVSIGMDGGARLGCLLPKSRVDVVPEGPNGGPCCTAHDRAERRASPHHCPYGRTTGGPHGAAAYGPL